MSTKERLESNIYYGLDGCWYWTGALFTKGYGCIQLNGSSQRVHRVAFHVYKGIKPDDKLLVCHTCDHPSCINPDHLFLGSSLENTQDMIKKGRHSFGSKTPTAKLSEATVLQIKMLSGSLSSRKLASMFGVEKTAILRIIKGKRWKHV